MKAPPNRSDQDLLFDIELLTIQQVAKWAKVSNKSVYRWIEAGKIPVVKFGERTYRIPARAVIAQLKASGYEHLLNNRNYSGVRRDKSRDVRTTLKSGI